MPMPQTMAMARAKHLSQPPHWNSPRVCMRVHVHTCMHVLAHTRPCAPAYMRARICTRTCTRICTRCSTLAGARLLCAAHTARAAAAWQQSCDGMQCCSAGRGLRCDVRIRRQDLARCQRRAELPNLGRRAARSEQQSNPVRRARPCLHARTHAQVEWRTASTAQRRAWSYGRVHSRTRRRGRMSSRPTRTSCTHS